MMMDNHRFIQPNQMIGNSPSRTSETTDDFDPIDPCLDEDLDAIMPHDFDTNNPNSSSYARSVGYSSTDNSLNADTFFAKLLSSEFGGGGSEAKGMIGVESSPEDARNGMSSKMSGNMDMLDITLLEDVINSGTGDKNTRLSSAPIPLVSGESSMRSLQVRHQDGQEEADDDSVSGLFKNFPEAEGNLIDDSSIDKMLMGTIDSIPGSNPIPGSMEQLMNIPIMTMDDRNSMKKESSMKNSKKTDANTTNINLSLHRSADSVGSLCESLGSMPDFGVDDLESNEPLPIVHQMASQQQRTQQFHMQEDMIRQKGTISNENQKKPAAASSIDLIVNKQLSGLPQSNQMSKLGFQGLQQKKQELIDKLREINNMGQHQHQQQERQQQHQQQHQQQQQQQQQQPNEQPQFNFQQPFNFQQQVSLQQQQQQQQNQQQRLQGLSAASSMPSLRSGQTRQGQFQSQGQHQQQQQQNMSFGVNQPMMQQQEGGMIPGFLSPTPIGVDSSPTLFPSMNNRNNNTMNSLRQQQRTSSMFGNNSSNRNNNSQAKANISSVIGSKGKETPLTSFLRNKGTKNTNSMMSSQQQQQMCAQNATSFNSMNRRMNSNQSGILDATPMNFNSTNPFLRKQMMNNLDRSVNAGNHRVVHGLSGNGLSSATRRDMMQQMASSSSMSKSAKELQRKPPADFYESAGILSRHSSLDNISIVTASRHNGLTAGAAKVQNRRVQLRRSSNSNNSFANLAKNKNGSRRDLIKAGGGSSTRSLPGKSALGSSTRSLSSEDSTGSIYAIKAVGRSGHGAKHKLGTSSSSRRLSFQNQSKSTAALHRHSGDQQQTDNRQNDGWP